MNTQLTTKPKSISAFQITDTNREEFKKLNLFIASSFHPDTLCYQWDANNFSIEAGRGTELLKVGDWLINTEFAIMVATDAFVKENYEVAPVKEEPKVVVPPVTPVKPTVVPPAKPVEVAPPVVAPAAEVKPVVTEPKVTTTNVPGGPNVTPETKSSL